MVLKKTTICLIAETIFLSFGVMRVCIIMAIFTQNTCVEERKLMKHCDRGWKNGEEFILKTFCVVDEKIKEGREG